METDDGKGGGLTKQDGKLLLCTSYKKQVLFDTSAVAPAATTETVHNLAELLPRLKARKLNRQSLSHLKT